MTWAEDRPDLPFLVELDVLAPHLDSRVQQLARVFFAAIPEQRYTVRKIANRLPVQNIQKGQARQGRIDAPGRSGMA